MDGSTWLRQAWLARDPQLSESALDELSAIALGGGSDVGARWAAVARRERLTLKDALALVLAMRQLPEASPDYADRLAIEVADAWMHQLQEVDRLRSEFISTLSHELRTPLTAIAGSCELLLEDFAEDLADVHKEYIRLIDRSTALVRQLIDDVLDYTKLEAGEIQLHPEALNLEELLKDTTSLLSPLMEKKCLGLVFELDPEAPDAIGDPVRVRQILINLLSNAIKFTAEGGHVTLSTRSVRGGQIAISVRDTGTGIAPGDQHMVFERFKQVGEGHRKRGTGLGLPITKRLVELHDGTITLESEEGHGSTFTFTLPAAR